MGRSTTFPAGAAAAVLAIALGACGGSGGDSASDADANGGNELSWQDSPLQVALWGEQEARLDPDEAEGMELEAQESIRECMAEEGFEYTPFVFDDEQIDDIWADQQDDPVAWAKEHGFGNAVSYEQSGDMQVVDDPNEAYAETLDEAAREAFSDALCGGGPDVEYDEDGNAVDGEGNTLSEDEVEQLHMDFRPDGCQNEAYEAVWDVPLASDQGDDTMQRVEELYTDLEERTQADPRMQVLDEQYAECMAEAGHEGLSSEEDVWERLGQKEEELQVWNDPFADLSEEEMADMTEEDFEAILEGEDGGGPDPDKLAELKAFEIDLAVPHAECNQPVEQQRLEIRFTLEQELVDDPANAELFTRLRELHGSDA